MLAAEGGAHGIGSGLRSRNRYAGSASTMNRNMAERECSLDFSIG
jgi:hypothetical protein